jgi:hypothetical protein
LADQNTNDDELVHLRRSGAGIRLRANSQAGKGTNAQGDQLHDEVNKEDDLLEHFDFEGSSQIG